MFDEVALTKVNAEIYPIIVRAEARPADSSEAEANPTGNSQITMAVFEKKEEGGFHVQVIKQILWVNRVRYELQEIYGIGSTVAGDETDSGKECVICLSEPRDTTVLPCRHMVCSEYYPILFSICVFYIFFFLLVQWKKAVERYLSNFHPDLNSEGRTNNIAVSVLSISSQIFY